MLVPSAALALGEDGPFELPRSERTVDIAPGIVNRIPVADLITDSVEGELDLASARLAVPDGATEQQLDNMALSEDGTAMTVAGEGTWSVLGTDLVFTPDASPDPGFSPIAITVASVHGTRSLPAEFRLQPTDAVELQVTAGAGAAVSVDLGESGAGVAGIHLLLDGMPAGSTVTEDDSRIVIPEEGVWQYDAATGAVEFTPAASHLGRQPTTLRYLADNEAGATLRTGSISIVTPVLADMVRAAPFGQPVSFPVRDNQQNVSPNTLRLVPVGGPTANARTSGTTQDPQPGMARVNADGTEVIVDGQGRWSLDREAGEVTFTPESASVIEAAPMGITGADAEGQSAGTALLTIGYPALFDLVSAAKPGAQIVFRPLAPSGPAGGVAKDSLLLSAEGAAPGAVLAEDGLTMAIPGQGLWEIDRESGTITLTPESDLEAGATSTVRITGTGVHAGNPVSGQLTALVSAATPTLRDDEIATAPGRSAAVDLLANDTAGSAASPLQASSARLLSLQAANLGELDRFRGTRLVIPREGEYVVSSDGVLTFTPADGFSGRATPVFYRVEDAQGVPYLASAVVQVDPALAASAGSGSEGSAGINSLLTGLLPSSSSTAIVYGTIAVLISFAGAVSLFIGTRMESDRRTWKD